MSERSRERYRERRAHAPLGAHLAFILAAGFTTLLFGTRSELGLSSESSDPVPFLAAGMVLAICLILFTLLGRFLKSSRGDRRRRPVARHYEGMPAVEGEALGPEVPSGAERR